MPDFDNSGFVPVPDPKSQNKNWNM
jgi:hypothetical protein